MTEKKPTLKDLLVSSMRTEARVLSFHPTRQQLEDCRGGNLEPDSEQFVLQHLGLCRECSEWLLSRQDQVCATSLPHIGEASRDTGGASSGAAAPSSLERLRQWFGSGLRPRFQFTSLAAALAVVLAVCSTLQWQRAEGLVDELSNPQINVGIYQVKRPSRGAVARASTFDISSDSERFVLILPVEGGHDHYEIRALTTDGREIWSAREARPDALGVQLRLELSRRFLDEGSYVFEISGWTNGQLGPPTSHQVTLRYR